MDIEIINNQNSIDIDFIDMDKIKDLIGKILQFEGLDKNYKIDISFVDNDTIKSLNKEYRDVDRATDILSFPIDFHIPGKDDIYLGELIISLEKIIEQAKEYNHSNEREFYYLLTHGTFHLLGYDHISQEEKLIMRDKEEKIMEKFNITR